MAKRRIHAETTGDRTVKVYRDLETREYIVRLYIDGVLYSPADYFTDDRIDALDTAAVMCRPLIPRSHPSSCGCFYCIKARESKL